MVRTDDHELALCVEVAVDDGAWVESLPPAPGTRQVSVSFDSAELGARDRSAITELGYRVVGTGPVGHTSDVAHLMVSWDTVERHPRWWRALLDLAARVYDLRFGPVQLALRSVLDVHLTAHRNGTATTGRRSPARAPRPPSV